jgi:DNA-binding response OmpR family regulator
MKILAAEDNAIFRSMLKTMLTKWGYEPVIVKDGVEAWDILQREDAPKLLILDWMMPRMDGMELCRRLRMNRSGSYTYILMLTARTDSQDLVHAMEEGCDDYLTKPFNAHELRVRVAAGFRLLSAIAGDIPRVLPASPTPLYPTCFLSHSTKDSEFIEPMFAALDTEGVSCWYAPEDIKIGSDLRETFDIAIRKRDRLLVVLSENSVRSPWVQREVDRALDEETRRKQDGRTDWRVLFPIRLDDAIFNLDAGWASDVKRRHIGDFRNWKNYNAYQGAFQRLLRDLKAEGKNDEKGGVLIELECISSKSPAGRWGALPRRRWRRPDFLEGRFRPMSERPTIRQLSHQPIKSETVIAISGAYRQRPLLERCPAVAEAAHRMRRNSGLSRS